MKFQVFKDGKVVKKFKLSAAYMFGADAIPLHDSNKVKFKDGIIECKRKTLEAAGLALLWPVEGFGRILLPTTRLPKRKQPYNLNLELARAKLMQITLKREDWSLFEETSNFADLGNDARDIFIEALQNTADPAKASILADESLKKALIFAEKLTVKHAELVLAARCKNKTLSRHSLGCCIDPELIVSEKYRKRLFEMFGYVTVPVSWAQIEPKKDEYDFTAIDRCIDMLAGKRVAVCAGPLLCFSEEHLPKWLLGKKCDFEKVREAAYEFVTQFVSRYARHIHVWRVISGMNACNYLDFNFEQVIEMTRTACLAAKSAEPKSRKLVEIVLPWGEYYAWNRQTVPPLVYADMIIQSGIGFDGFALQLCFGKDQPGMHIRDMMQISARLDCFAPIAKSLHITGVTIPGQGDGDGQNGQAAGSWHGKWDQSIQSKWIERIYKVALGKPFINSITYSNLADVKNMPMPECGLLTEDLEPKKAFRSLAKLQKLILNK